MKRSPRCRTIKGSIEFYDKIQLNSNRYIKTLQKGLQKFQKMQV